jgi:hypothetical protein
MRFTIDDLPDSHSPIVNRKYPGSRSSITEHGASNTEDEGEIPSASANFGWLAEKECPGPENRVSLRAAQVRSLHHPPFKTQNERKFHEACSPLPKPVALSQELQTKSYPNQTGEGEFHFSPGALRSETANQNL